MKFKVIVVATVMGFVNTFSSLTGLDVLAKLKPVAPTVKSVNRFDYFEDSVTHITNEAYTREEINKLIEPYGTFDGPMGMPVEEYKEAMDYKWTDCTEYKKKAPTNITIDLTKKYRYSTLVNIMKKLSRIDGVYLFDIGETTEGRRMYAMEIDIPSDKKKTTVILTGNTHARETAGAVYVMKSIVDLLMNDTEKNREILANIKFAVVACVNPDGRDGVLFETNKYTYSDGQLLKAATNGTDINRNLPGLAWSQVAKGNNKTEYISYDPKKLYYPGDYACSLNESKAIMKFLYHYIVREKAQVYVDYHQQGRIAYAGKPWQTKEQEKRCKNMVNTYFETMNAGNEHKYVWWGEVDEYNLDGTGSTLTDFAVSLSVGAKFSPGYGFYVYTDGKNEYPLIRIPDLDDDNKGVMKETNKKFATNTFEIGYGKDYLGGSEKTRKLQAKEYDNYHFGEVLWLINEYIKK